MASRRAWRPKPPTYASQSKRPSRIPVLSMELCPSGKSGYRTKSDAKRVLGMQQTHGSPISRAYRCTVGDCKLYHLTKQPRHLG